MSINPNHKPMVSPMTVVPEQAQENNRRYWLWLVSLTIVCCGLIVAAGVSYYYRYHSRLHFTPEITISPNRQFFLDDPILGYRNNPGTYTITITNRQVGKSLAFKVVVDDQGYRTTSPSPKVYEGKPEIWLFGCSYTWGWELNNPETFPWLLQARLVDYKINNYAVAGYGNVHGYLQLKQALDQGRLAIMAVFVYNYFHLPRNVAAPSRLMEFQSVRDIGLLHHPQAYVDGSGNLHVKTIPLLPVQQPDSEKPQMIEVTQKIFGVIYARCSSNDIIPVLAVQTEPADDPVVSFCRQQGFVIVDMTVDNTKPEYNNEPLGAHPNAKANAIYAQKLGDGLQAILERRNRPQGNWRKP